MSGDNSSRDALSRSARLSSTKFSGLLEQHIRPEERVLLADDCGAELFDNVSMKMKMHFDLAAVLTDERLLLFRGRGVLGAKQPFVLPLAEVDHIGVTRQGNVSVQSTGPHGAPSQWKLHLGGDERLADEWMTVMHGACEALGSSDDAAPAPGAAPTRVDDVPSAGARSAEERALFGALHDFVDDVRHMASADVVGTPFGPGCGLEEALEHLRRRVRSTEVARGCARLMMVDLLVAAQDEEVAGAALRAMGATPTATAQSRVDDVQGMGAAAVHLLSQHGGPGSMWDLWLRRNDVVAEMLCWHTVARLRLATTGYMEPVARP